MLISTTKAGSGQEQRWCLPPAAAAAACPTNSSSALACLQAPHPTFAHARQRLAAEPGAVGEADGPVAIPAAIRTLDAAPKGDGRRIAWRTVKGQLRALPWFQASGIYGNARHPATSHCTDGATRVAGAQHPATSHYIAQATEWRQWQHNSPTQPGSCPPLDVAHAPLEGARNLSGAVLRELLAKGGEGCDAR